MLLAHPPTHAGLCPAVQLPGLHAWLLCRCTRWGTAQHHQPTWVPSSTHTQTGRSLPGRVLSTHGSAAAVCVTAAAAAAEATEPPSQKLLATCRLANRSQETGRTLHTAYLTASTQGWLLLLLQLLRSVLWVGFSPWCTAGRPAHARFPAATGTAPAHAARWPCYGPGCQPACQAPGCPRCQVGLCEGVAGTLAHRRLRAAAAPLAARGCSCCWAAGCCRPLRAGAVGASCLLLRRRLLGGW